MRDDHIDLCGQVDFTRTEAMPLLEREAQFCFACAGCGDCCRGQGRYRSYLALTCGALQPGCACRRRSWPGAIAGPASGR